MIMKRRLLYWWHLLHTEDTEMVSKVYRAQKVKVERNDWISQLEEDKKCLNLTLSDQDVKLMSKSIFKRVVERQLFGYVKMVFENSKNAHSKSQNLPAYTGKPDPYLLSKNLNKEEMVNMFKLKTRMVQVYENFKNGQDKNKWCKMCFLFIEKQEHLGRCSKIREELGKVIDFNTFEYSHITGSLQQQEQFAKNFTLILKKREDIIARANRVSPNGDQSTGGGVV